MTQSIHCTVKYRVDFDGTLEDYVEMADRMAVPHLDSKDGGDATGFYISEHQRQQPEDGILIMSSPGTVGQWPDLKILVTVTCDQDFFIWDPPL